jgi:hypothetical protein
MDSRIDQEDRRLLGAPITRRILQSAIAVHKEMGPGLLESVYRACLLRDLEVSGLHSKAEVEEDKVLLELKTVEKLLPIHDAQLFTYLKLSGLRVGFLMNFNSVQLRNSLRRWVL